LRGELRRVILELEEGEGETQRRGEREEPEDVWSNG